MDPITKALYETWKNIVTNKTNKLNENVSFADVKHDIAAGNSELGDWHEDKYSGMWVKDDGIDRDANISNYNLDQFNQEMERKYGKTETGSYKTSLDDTDYKRKQDLEAAQLAAYRRQEEREVGEQERYTVSVKKQEQQKRQDTARQQLRKERGEKIRKGEDLPDLTAADVTARERQLEREEQEKLKLPYERIKSYDRISKTPTPNPSYTPIKPTPTGTKISNNMLDLIKKDVLNNNKIPNPDWIVKNKDIGGRERAAAKAGAGSSLPDFQQAMADIYNRIPKDKKWGDAGPGGYGTSYDAKPQPIIPTRTPAPQPAAPATTGSGLLNNIMNFNKKAYKSVTGSLPTMPKIYEERDAEGQKPRQN